MNESFYFIGMQNDLKILYKLWAIQNPVSNSKLCKDD